jgi:hypothetical protein
VNRDVRELLRSSSAFFFVSFVFFTPGCLQLDALKSRRWVEEEVEEE